MKRKAFQAALPYTLPIFIGFLFIGLSYGFLMTSKGFSVFYPIAMSIVIYAGAMQFVAVSLLLSTFSPALRPAADPHGQRPPSVLRHRYAGKIQAAQAGKNGILIFGIVRRNLFHQLHRRTAGRRRYGLVPLLRHRPESPVLGRQHGLRRLYWEPTSTSIRRASNSS